MIRLTVALALFFQALFCVAQELNVPVPTYVRSEKWNASWIVDPEVPVSEYSLTLYRRTFELAEQPDSFIIHITADNRYRLFVNNNSVCYGPQLGDMRHWHYETVNIASWLKPGKNIVAVEVTNFGPNRFYGLISVRTGLLIQGFSERESVVNTNDKGWKSYHVQGFTEVPVNWMFGVDVVGGFFASNHGEQLQAASYPWGWKTLEFDDSGWQVARWNGPASPNGGGFAWLLTPRTTPLQTDSIDRFTSVARMHNLKTKFSFSSKPSPVNIPANTTCSFMIDQKHLTIGYPELWVSGGKDAEVKITYAENLYNEKLVKGNRNEIEGKTIRGLHDVFIPDGGADRMFRPNWMRSFRFVQVDITTKNEPLVINDFYNVYSAVQLPLKATFKSDNSVDNQIIDMCWRSVSLCNQDNLVSDAYYEQMQYVGDSRVHAMTNLFLTGDTLYLRNAIDKFNNSRLPDGNITSCYPLKATFVHPTFSLIWIDMLWDYMMYSGDKAFIKKYLPALPLIFYYFEDRMASNGLVGKTEWPYFVDWYKDGGGVNTTSRQGNSALVSLHLAYTYNHAADILTYMGQPEQAAVYRKRGAEITQRVKELCFDNTTGLFAENPDKQFKDQRPNIIAVLTDAVPAAQQAEIMQKITTDSTLSQAGYYYRFNYFNALRKSHTGYLFDQVVEPWRELLKLGMTTTPERPYRQRSDCHPWSTSPAYAFFHVVCGIESAEPGFKTVTIEPALGTRKFIEAVYPHPSGSIELKLKKTKQGGLQGTIVLPADLHGTFINGKQQINLKPGKNTI